MRMNSEPGANLTRQVIAHHTPILHPESVSTPGPKGATGDRSMNSDSLRHAFLANGLFSLVCGLVFLLDGHPLGTFVGLPQGPILQPIGAGLVPFGGWLLWLSRRPELTPRIGLLVSIMDAQWVVGTVLLLAGWPELLNKTGQALAIGIALVVTAFALWQVQGARRIVAIS